jgi:hypothetical protein
MQDRKRQDKQDNRTKVTDLFLTFFYFCSIILFILPLAILHILVPLFSLRPRDSALNF